MLVSLTPHPATSATAIDRLDVEVRRGRKGALRLEYRLCGDLDRIRLPDMGGAGRTDGLWRHTCYEAFVLAHGVEGYVECNFAGPRWAAYRFAGYRQGMAPAAVEPPILNGSRDGSRCTVEMALDLAPDFSTAIWRVGLSAVIEDVDGGISYWALAHPSDKPDFHHPDSFVLELPPVEPA